MKILRTASLGSKFTGSYKKESIPMIPSILEASRCSKSSRCNKLGISLQPR